MTDRTEQIYDLLCKNERTTVREIQAALGISSTSVVEYHLRKLRRDGLVAWPDRQSRGYRVLGRPDPAARVVELAREFTAYSPALAEAIREYEAGD